MTRRTIVTARANLTDTALPPPSPRDKAAAPVESGAMSDPNSRPTVTGIVKGTPHRLTAGFLDALCADFEAHGANAIRNCREEQPHGYLRLIAGLLPKDVDFNKNRLKDIADDELDLVMGLLREHAARSADAAEREPGKGPASL